MHRLSVIILLTILTGLITMEARSQDFIRIDSATYAQYLAGDWKTLVRDGKEALRQGVDYYYLRMRLGIAQYELKNFRAATTHFIRALEFSADDPPAGEYLYYCHINTGQRDRAEMYRNNFKGKLAVQLPPERIKFVKSISGEYLYSSTFNDNYVDAAQETFADYTSGYQSLTRDFHNASLALSHSLSPGITLSHAYTWLGKTSFMYLHDGIDVSVYDGLKVNQNQYYLSPSISTPTGLTIMPSVHILGISYQVISSGGNGFGPWNDVGLNTRRTNAVVGGLRLTQAVGPLNITAGGNYSNLNDAEQVLLRGGLTWFPTGNLDLYFGCFMNAQFRNNGISSSANMIPEYLIGAGIGSKVWVEVFGSHGDMFNYTEGN